MKLTPKQRTAKQIQAIELLKQGFTQKQIAQTIVVTEKTIGIWLKPYKEAKATETNNLRLFNMHLSKLLNAETPNVLEIDRLTKAMNEYKKGLVYSNLSL